MLLTFDRTSSIGPVAVRRGGAEFSTPTGVMEDRQLDRLLVPFVQAADDSESERLLTSLIAEHAAPVVSKIVNYKARAARSRASADAASAEAEDVQAEVMLQLVQRLQSFRRDYAARPIKDFAAYVAATTFNAYDRHVSRKYPQRRRLKNGLRYLLTHHAGLALWQGEQGSWVGGLQQWRALSLAGNGADDAASSAAARRLQQLRDDPRAFARDGGAPRVLSDPKRGAELLQSLFAWTGAPVELDLLVGVVAEWWGVTDEVVAIGGGRGVESEGADEGVQVADARPDTAVGTERRAYLQRLWDEIVELPPRQRAAVLLNLRDEQGRGVIDLWMLTGVAAVEAVAGALSMTVDEFAELWDELPLDDNRIAAHLNVTRQQVINLRKSARERLARRMKGF